ncbi:MAG: DNA polymerase III subunit delta [Oscillospiraceae bacterium]|nr:DNA polymerase III subunit delta [Oscillospiraceae bacterium]
MARGEKKTFNYSEELRKLRAEGPARLYMLRGEEDFLRDSFLRELRSLCVEEGTEAFNYHRLQGLPDISALREAVEAMPFMGERTLVEVRDFDINRVTAYDPEDLKALVSDLPEWTTLAFLFSPGYAPDNRLGAVKAIRKNGIDLEFTAPRETELVRWLTRRAESLGKRIEPSTASYFLWVCGTRMNALIPELLKIAGAAAGEEITRADIDAVAKRAPETTIFNLTDALGAGEYDRAAALLADLLADRDEPPQRQIAMVSEQFRRLLVAKVAAEHQKPDRYITDCIPELTGRAYPLSLLKRACRNFSRSRRAHAVLLCVDCDLGMKSGGPDPEELMKELILHLAMDRV